MQTARNNGAEFRVSDGILSFIKKIIFYVFLTSDVILILSYNVWYLYFLQYALQESGKWWFLKCMTGDVLKIQEKKIFFRNIELYLK
jgi:hypothetical protein